MGSGLRRVVARVLEHLAPIVVDGCRALLAKKMLLASCKRRRGATTGREVSDSREEEQEERRRRAKESLGSRDCAKDIARFKVWLGLLATCTGLSMDEVISARRNRTHADDAWGGSVKPIVQMSSTSACPDVLTKWLGMHMYIYIVSQVRERV